MAGARTDPLRTRSEEHQLSRPTIRQAIELLIRMGFSTPARAGTLCTAQAARYFEVLSFSEDMRNRGLNRDKFSLILETVLPEKLPAC